MKNLLLIMTMALSAAACSDSADDTPGDGADADTDSDSDSDSDSDVDADSDSDGDTDTCPSDGPEPDPNLDCDSSSGVCVDNGTGLMWEMNVPSNSSYDYHSANTQCTQMTKAGYSDWRLPTINELRTLIRGCPQTEAGGECEVSESCVAVACADADCSYCSNGTGSGGGGGGDSDSDSDIDSDTDSDTDSDADTDITGECPGPDCPNPDCVICGTFWEGPCSGCGDIYEDPCTECFIVPNLNWDCYVIWSGTEAPNYSLHRWAVDFRYGRLAITGNYQEGSNLYSGGGGVGCVRDVQ